MRQCPVGLPDDQHHHAAKAMPSPDFDLLPMARMERVVDRHHTPLVLSSMSLYRPAVKDDTFRCSPEGLPLDQMWICASTIFMGNSGVVQIRVTLKTRKPFTIRA